MTDLAQHAPPRAPPRCLAPKRAKGVARQALAGESFFQAKIFRPPLFDFKKLTTVWLSDASRHGPLLPTHRRYTLTHNDLTGALHLSVGQLYNLTQIGGWYTRLIRDEVLAEWLIEAGGAPALHVYCHVSGRDAWLAPPALRDWIFQREMPLVLDTLLYADRDLFSRDARLLQAPVYIHLASHVKELNRVVHWGTLGRRDTWPVSSPELRPNWQTRWQLRERFTAEVSEAAPAASLALVSAPAPLAAAVQPLPELVVPAAAAAQPPERAGLLLDAAGLSGAAREPLAVPLGAVEPGAAPALAAAAGWPAAQAPPAAGGAGPGERPLEEELCEVTWRLNTRGWAPEAEVCGAAGAGGVRDRESFVAGFREGVQAERQGRLARAASGQLRPGVAVPAGLGGPEGGQGEPLGEVVTAADIVAKWLASGAEVVSVRRGKAQGPSPSAAPVPAGPA